MHWVAAHVAAPAHQRPRSEFSDLDDGRQAAALARAGLTIAKDTATPALAVQLNALEGRGLALLGDASGARRAVQAAEGNYERSRDGAEPPWLGFYTEAAFAADLGKCLSDLGEPRQAITLSTRALQGYEPWRVRARCFAQTDLVRAHLLGRDLEQPAALGRDALRTAADVSSHPSPRSTPVQVKHRECGSCAPCNAGLADHQVPVLRNVQCVYRGRGSLHPSWLRF